MANEAIANAKNFFIRKLLKSRDAGGGRTTRDGTNQGIAKSYREGEALGEAAYGMCEETTRGAG
jgi:hypothetical protein